LDDYEENTFTPALKFGGNSVGMTYTTQVGKYTKIGNRILWEIYIQLSNKGTSVGAATITGMPFTSSATGAHFYLGEGDSVGGGTVDAYYNVSSTTLLLYPHPPGAQYNDTNFANGSNLRLYGHYCID
jgi:hypothetical protein